MTKLLDTSIVLYGLEGRLGLPLGASEYAISVITEMELLSFPQLTTDQEESIRLFISKIRVCGLSRPVREKAIELRRKFALKLPDAIIAATAFVYACDLITNDKALLKLSDISAYGIPLIES
ncbi:MAG: type II toxin-antitoxin system VapC family toxin [Candidatus Hydrogenedentales bacterium]|jgi:hypothetical protein